MTNYRLYRNRIQVAVGLAVCSPLSATALFIMYDPKKGDWTDILAMLSAPLLFAFAAVQAYRLARLSWWDYYAGGGTSMSFSSFVRERREWKRNGYRHPIEIKLGKPPRTRPPADCERGCPACKTEDFR